MNIVFGGHDVILHPSGVLFWPDQSLLVVSDLHLEKGSHFARKGYYLPPYDSLETLQRLLTLCGEFAPKKIILLGDSFHDGQGYERLNQTERSLLNALRAHRPIWIVGNHDKDFVPDGFEPHVDYKIEGIVFRHESLNDDSFEISGHYHPKTEIKHKGAIIMRPCFVEDGVKLIMPAFGAYTGGLSVGHNIYKSVLKPNPRIYALGLRKVYAVSNHLKKSSI